MTRRSFTAFVLANAFLPLGARGADKGGELQVSLTPAGSFTARDEAIKTAGESARAGDAWKLGMVTVDLRSLKTGIELRDKHMKEKYLEVGKFPEAHLKSAAGKDGKFKGELTVHGVTKPVEGTYEFKGQELVAKFNVKASDFKISQAKYMGVGVEDDVEVKAQFPFPAK